MSQERKRKLRQEGVFNGITERRVRGQSKLRVKQSKNNTITPPPNNLNNQLVS
jgi:hypothetical protein